MEIVDRYIHEVVINLPEEQRKGVEEELKALINAMMQKYPSGESEVSKVEKALFELGDPVILSEKYSNKKKYLIGPKYYRNYTFVLKIVLAAVLLGVSIASGLEGISSPEKGFYLMIIHYLSSLMSGLLQGFLWVTLIFMILERKGVDLPPLSDEKKWKPKNLYKTSKNKARIPISDGIAGIIFTTIFMMLIYFSPQLFGAYFHLENGELVKIPLFNIAALRGYDTLIIVLFLVSIAKEMVKIIYGRWSIKSSIIYSILNILSTTLILVIFFSPEIWNPNFFTEISRHVKMEFGTGITLQMIWKGISNWIVIIILATTVLEISKAIYKGIKYNSTSYM